MLSEYQCLRKLGSFSIDDPEAGRKLVENLDHRRVRVQVIEVCWHFGFKSPDGLDRMRIKAFLDDLCARGEMVQPIAGLYCRPDMTVGRASVEEAMKKLEGLRDVKARLRVERIAAEPPKAKRNVTPPKRNARKPIAEAAPAIDEPKPSEAVEAPKLIEMPKPAVPKPRQVSSLQRQTEWILLCIRARGGQASKASVAAAAVASGIVATPSDIDVPLQHLFNRTRAYLKDHLLTLTQFGEREAEYLHLRRDALGHATDGA
jgi:hypothetical protein